VLVTALTRPLTPTSPRRIHVIHRGPVSPSQRPPLLFVHGGYVDARCWDLNLLPYFADHGYDCYAVDLSGHGHSEGRPVLDRLSLDDYLADVLGVVKGLREPPVLIGHSMGAVLAERVLERSRARAGVLMSPVPVNGTLESATRLFVSHPSFLVAVAEISRGILDSRGLNALREVYFTPRTPLQRLLEFARLVQPESLRAVADLAFLAWQWPSPTPDLPVFVIGGEHDRVFPPSMIARVARRWHGELHIVPAAGHAMIVDDEWQACAAPVLGWLEKVVGEPRPASLIDEQPTDCHQAPIPTLDGACSAAS